MITTNDIFWHALKTCKHVICTCFYAHFFSLLSRKLLNLCKYKAIRVVVRVLRRHTNLLTQSDNIRFVKKQRRNEKKEVCNNNNCNYQLYFGLKVQTDTSWTDARHHHSVTKWMTKDAKNKMNKRRLLKNHNSFAHHKIHNLFAIFRLNIFRAFFWKVNKKVLLSIFLNLELNFPNSIWLIDWIRNLEYKWSHALQQKLWSL